jgi:hypothetical protein
VYTTETRKNGLEEEEEDEEGDLFVSNDTIEGPRAPRNLVTVPSKAQRAV